MKKSVKKILALIVSLALIFSTVALNFNFSASAESLEPGESFEKVKGSYLFYWTGMGYFDDDFVSCIVEPNSTTAPEIVLPSAQWTTNNVTGVQYGIDNRSLTPKEINPTGTYVLTLKDTKTTNFRASIEFLNTYKEYGLYFGQSQPYDLDVANGAAKITMQGNAGSINASGVKPDTAKFVDSSVNATFYKSGNVAYDKASRPNFDTAVNNTNYHILNIEVINGVLKLWWTGYETYAWTVELSEKYSGGYISLYSRGAAQGGIKEFKFEDLGGVTEYEKDFTGINVSTINRDFSAAHIASDGTVTTGKASTLWSTAKQPTGAERHEFQNSYLKPVNNGGTYLLTLNNTKVVNFRASINLLNNWKEYGIYFGQSTPTDIAVSDTDTNGTAKVKMHENVGKILAQGVYAETTLWADASRTKASGDFYYNADKKYVTNDQTEKFSNAVNSTNLHTLNIEVINGLLKVWWTGFEEYAWTVELTDSYKGGYVSLYSTGCAQGGIKSFTFEDLGGYIQSFSWLGLGEIKDEYTANKKNSDGTFTTGTPAELWSTDVNPSGATADGRQNHFLKPAVNDSTLHLLTLNDVKVKNFRASVKLLNNYHDYGIYFGQETPTDIDVSSTSADGVVKVSMFGQGGSILAYGVYPYTAKWVGSQGYGEFYPHRWVNNPYSRRDQRNNTAIEGFDTSVNGTNLHTLNIEVIDGEMKLWWSEYPDAAWTVSLNEGYKGGYISLYATGNAHGGIKKFSLMELPDSDYTFTATETTELDDKFTATVYNTEDGSVTTTKVSENWRLDNVADATTGKGAIEEKYYNNALKPFGRKSAKKLSVLTLNEELSNNFQLDFTYVVGHTGYNLYLSDGIENPNALPANAVTIGVNNALIGEDYYPLLTVKGAVDVTTASVANPDVTLYCFGGNSANTYLSDLGCVYDTSVTNCERMQVNVKVEDGTLTAWITGYEAAALTVKLTAKFNANKCSIYTNGCDQGGLINLNVVKNSNSAVKNANVDVNLKNIGEYTVVTLNTDLDHSKIATTLNFDVANFEYYASALNMEQMNVNKGAVIAAENGVIDLDLYADAKGHVVTLYFKNLTNSLDYRSFVLGDTAVNVTNNTAANAKAATVLDYDYNTDFEIDVRDLIKSKLMVAEGESVTVIDLVSVRKLILGTYTSDDASPLVGMSALYLGDSIAYGALDERGLSWAGRIAQNGMIYENVAVSGWSVTNTETSKRGQIVTQLDRATRNEYDFVILEGGVNDVLIAQNTSDDINIAWGSVVPDGTEFDTSTIAGAIEDLIVKTQAKFPNAIVGYVINNYFGASEENMTKYIETVKAACDKHGVEYLDLNANEYVQTNFVVADHLPDNLHPNAAGYDILSTAIGEWMEGLVLNTH